jgi:hypothetical protein
MSKRINLSMVRTFQVMLGIHNGNVSIINFSSSSLSVKQKVDQ